MSTVFDASALIAFLRDEPGAQVVETRLSTPQGYVHALNLCEVYYDFWRAANQEVAESAIIGLTALGLQERNDAAPWRWLTGWAQPFSTDRHELEPLLKHVFAKSN